MSFKDFDELVTRAPKRLPIGGHLFEFPQRISAQTGATLLAVQTVAADLGPDSDPQAIFAATGLEDEALGGLIEDMLGEGRRQLVEAGFGDAIPHVFKTLTAWHLYGQEAAEQVWNSLGPTPAPNRAARRSAATGTSTKRPASPAGSTSRKAPAKAARPGRSSAATGR